MAFAHFIALLFEVLIHSAVLLDGSFGAKGNLSLLGKLRLLCDISTCFIRARVFGEVKPCNVDNRSAAIDLVRLCVFGKDNIDVHKADKILLFHVIGCKVTFYVETLYDEGLYVVAELCTVTLPSSLKEFAALTENVDNLLDVYLTMKTVSCNLDQCKWEANRRDTLDTPSFRAAMSKSKHHQTCLVLM